MQRWASILVCLVLLLGGFCNYTCFAQAEHQCCHKTPTASSLQSHPPVPAIQTIPALPEIGFVLHKSPDASSHEVLTTPFTWFAPSLPPLILRV